MPARISTEELLNELCRLADELERTPKSDEMDSQGNFSCSVYTTRFGRWNQALERAGLEPNRHSDVSNKNLIEELHRLSKEHGHSPRVKDNEAGKYGTTLYKSRFGSWNEALEAADLPLNHDVTISSDRLIRSIQSVAQRLNRSPTRKEYTEHSSFYGSTCEQRFGSWNDALLKAGLKPNHLIDIPKADLLDDLLELSERLGCVPTQHDIDKSDYHSANVYCSRFGSWNEALQRAGLDPINRTDIPRSELVDELSALAEKLERSPTIADMERLGCFSYPTYFETFGSWNNSLKAIGLSPNQGNSPKSLYNALLKYLPGDDWQTISSEVRSEARGVCELCGEKPSSLSKRTTSLPS